MISDKNTWRDGLRKFYGPSSCNKWYQLSTDVHFVAVGLKPAYLLDTLKPDASLFLSLLNYVLLQQNLHHRSDEVVKWERELRVVSVGSDVLVINWTAMKDLFHECHHTFCVYVDISKAPSQSSSTSGDGTDAHVNIQCSSEVEDKCRQWYYQLLAAEKYQSSHAGSSEKETTCLRLLSVELPPDLNLCTLFGRLLGYPVVYWFPPSVDYSLDNVKLLNFKVYVSAYSDCHDTDDHIDSVKVAYTC